MRVSIDGDILLNEYGGNGLKPYRNEEREVITARSQYKIGVSHQALSQTHILFTKTQCPVNVHTASCCGNLNPKCCLMGNSATIGYHGLECPALSRSGY